MGVAVLDHFLLFATSNFNTGIDISAGRISGLSHAQIFATDLAFLEAQLTQVQDLHIEGASQELTIVTFCMSVFFFIVYCL